MKYSEVRRIKNRDDFVRFLKCLKKDYLENMENWENKDVGAFLEAMASWVEDMDGFYINQGLPVPKSPDWQVFADILMGGKLYE